METHLTVETIRNVRIPMADGVTLAADLYLPAAARQGQTFPAIVEYTPYHKNNNAVYGPRATRYPYFASRGYVFVNVDIRGTGDSEGFNTSPTSPEEVQDNLQVIRWCARQPWSAGGVGMIGISYTAGVCYDAARQAPPELKAMVLCQMTSDWHAGMACPGGSLRPFVFENYAPLMAAYNFAPPNPDLVGANWSAIWRQRLERSVPWGVAYLQNLLDGPFWESRLLRGDAARVRAATFLMGGWCDWYPDDFLRVFAQLQCPKRVLIGPWTHNYPENAWPLPRINDRHECLRWFDKHLKGIDTDRERPLDGEAPVTLFVQDFNRPQTLRREDQGRFQSEAQWPPEGVEPSPLRLTGDHRLVPDAALGRDTDGSPTRHDLAYRPDVGVAAGRYAIGQMLPGWGMPDDQRLDAGLSLVYASDPLPDSGPRELIGSPEARLWVSSTAEVAFLSVKLCDVAPDGTSVLVSKGVLNLTHRNSSSQPEPLRPGQVYEINLPLLAAAYRFRPEHRICVMIAAADFQNAWPTPTSHTLSVHFSPDRPSQVILPFARPDRTTPPAPTFLPSDFPPLPPDQLPTPEYAITRDLVRNSVSVRIDTQSGVGRNRSTYTINIDCPAEATIDSEYEYSLSCEETAIRVHARCATRSDAREFQHQTDVEITIDGRPHWSKRYAVSAPRPGC